MSHYNHYNLSNMILPEFPPNKVLLQKLLKTPNKAKGKLEKPISSFPNPCKKTDDSNNVNIKIEQVFASLQYFSIVMILFTLHVATENTN